MTSCESTITYQYDLLNRQVIITDSQSGVITRTFDDLGRLVHETNPQSSVSYAYDTGGRLITKTIAGQTPFTYAYNAVDQVLSITQGTQSVQFTYDNGGRAATLTFPNGIVASYTYDPGSRITEIDYNRSGTLIGNLTYSYDALNRRVGVGGTLAGTVLPPAIESATYDAANQIVSWNGTAFSYDANGSLVNDGQNTYTWNGRGQLAGISGPVNASFAYDASGRRIAKIIGANSLGFSYDGGGISQELTGGTVTASIWSGGSNGFLQRTDASGTVVPLTDALGSIMALADASGNLLTQYSYDPFGATVASGAAIANPFQYIGRENDLTGLYYLHARYYSTALMRFISEDPLGFGGGDVNLHAYSLNSPTNLSDPNGTNPLLIGCAFGAGLDVLLELTADKLTGRKLTWSNAADYALKGCLFGAGGVALTLGPALMLPVPAIASPFVATLAAEAGEAAGLSAESAMADSDSVWGLPALDRGIAVENSLAATEYADWYRVGAEDGGTFPLVDFQKGDTLVSLKTADTNSSSWLSAMEEHIADLGTRGATVNESPANIVLDLRVQPGGAGAAQPLVDYGARYNVTVKISEYR